MLPMGYVLSSLHLNMGQESVYGRCAGYVLSGSGGCRAAGRSPGGR